MRSPPIVRTPSSSRTWNSSERIPATSRKKTSASSVSYTSVGGFHLGEATNPTGRPCATSLKYTSSSSARCTVKLPEPREERPEKPLSAMVRNHRPARRRPVEGELLGELPHPGPYARDRRVVLVRQDRVEAVRHDL